MCRGTDLQFLRPLEQSVWDDDVLLHDRCVSLAELGLVLPQKRMELVGRKPDRDCQQEPECAGTWPAQFAENRMLAGPEITIRHCFDRVNLLPTGTFYLRERFVMRVNQLCSYVGGGAGMAARRLHESLLAADVQSRFWYWKLHKDIEIDDTFQEMTWANQKLSGPRRTIERVVTKVRKSIFRHQVKRASAGRSSRYEMFSPAYLPNRTPLDHDFVHGDILQLHWVSDLIDHKSFFASIPDSLPIVWTLHDMNPFSGGCHYANGCEKYATGCESCPQLANPSQRDLSARSFRIKLYALQSKNLHVVTPSHWLQREARRSRVFAGAKSFQTIHNGLDTDIYSPRERSKVRRKLKLPDDVTVIGFGAHSLGAQRKGFHLLLDALAKLQTETKVMGLVFGSGSVPDSDGNLPTIRTAGVVNDQRDQSDIYSAFDMVVIPSIEDNLPNIGVEAMACGTPVIAFDTGGIPDYVHPNETGLLANVGDSDDLARQISWLVDRPEEIRRMGNNARQLAIRQFNASIQVHKYIELYESILHTCVQQTKVAA